MWLKIGVGSGFGLVLYYKFLSQYRLKKLCPTLRAIFCIQSKAPDAQCAGLTGYLSGLYAEDGEGQKSILI